jgi:hypothetical protein
VTEVIDKLTPLLEKLAASLQTTVEELYIVLVRQAIAEGVWSIVMISIFLSIAFIAGRIATMSKRLAIKSFADADASQDYHIRRENPSFWWERSEAMGWWIGWIVIIICILVALFPLHHAVVVLINPEYRALMLLRAALQ